MKKLVKPMILLVMVAILATLIIIPSSVSARDIEAFPGIATTFAGLPACACPGYPISCACLMYPPVS